MEPVLLFDGVCNYCNKMVNFAIRNDKKGKIKFAPLQSTAGETLRQAFNISPASDTIVLIENGKAFIYATAAIRVCRYLDWPAKMLFGLIIFPSFLTQPVYKWIARNRYKWFGRKDSCMIPTPGIKNRFLN
jgi:predicted DCC family thiol-disulfide oxidoreductase YuxK